MSTSNLSSINERSGGEIRLNWLHVPLPTNQPLRHPFPLSSSSESWPNKCGEQLVVVADCRCNVVDVKFQIGSGYFVMFTAESLSQNSLIEVSHAIFDLF